MALPRVHIGQGQIRSAAWGAEEVSYEEWADRSRLSRKRGYEKILGACRLAKVDGYDHLCVDTNCIDKRNSAELTEAINSMFLWYQSAEVCYAYLSDIPTLEPSSLKESLARSRWFTRGWTLQELLAPFDVGFYAADWSFLGTKHDLSSAISSITGIDEEYLQSRTSLTESTVRSESESDGTDGETPETAAANRARARRSFSKALSSASIAERMSWLAGRKTKRQEDMAYCMLGIFDINMPLLYGERSKAFIRLQEEIMKVSDDHSIFAWLLKPDSATSGTRRNSLLCPDPSGFSGHGHFIPPDGLGWQRPSPYSITRAGLSIRLPIIHCYSPFYHIAVFRFKSKSPEDGYSAFQTFGIFMGGDFESGIFHRLPHPWPVIPLAYGTAAESKSVDIFVTPLFGDLPYLTRHPGGSDTKLSVLGAALLMTTETPGLLNRIDTHPRCSFDEMNSTLLFRRHSKPPVGPNRDAVLVRFYFDVRQGEACEEKSETILFVVEYGEGPETPTAFRHGRILEGKDILDEGEPQDLQSLFQTPEISRAVLSAEYCQKLNLRASRSYLLPISWAPRPCQYEHLQILHLHISLRSRVRGHTQLIVQTSLSDGRQDGGGCAKGRQIAAGEMAASPSKV